MKGKLGFYQERGAAGIAIPLLWVSYVLYLTKFLFLIPGAIKILDDKEMKPHAEFEEIFITVLLLCSCVFFAWLILSISRGRGWARNTYFAFALFDVYSFVSTHSHIITIHNVLSVLVIAAEMPAMIILFFMSSGLFEKPHDRAKLLQRDVKKSDRPRRNSGATVFAIFIGLFCLALFRANGVSTNALYLAGFVSLGLVSILLLLTFKYNLLKRKSK